MPVDDDAGALPDAGVSDAGGADGGLHDAGAVELCDGVDNDFDGLVDVLPDGGPLTRPCALTLGVCTGSTSTCIDAGWAVCDYGPNYQYTERNCDGLDNDCDGRVDVSWARQVFVEDGGSSIWPLGSATTSLVRHSDSAWLVLPNRYLTLNVDLEVVANTKFPIVGDVRSELFPDGDHWVRISSNWSVDAGYFGACASAHVMLADGGFTIDAGEVASVPTFCAEGSSVVAVPHADGWFGVISKGGAGSSTNTIAWAQWSRDGGMASGVTASFASTSSAVERQGSQLFLVEFCNGCSMVSALDSDTAQLTLVRDRDAGACHLIDSTEPVMACQTPMFSETLLYMDGGVAHDMIFGRWLYSTEPLDRVFALTFDAGATYPATLSVLSAGTLHPIAVVEEYATTWQAFLANWTLHAVSGRLYLATWNGLIPGRTSNSSANFSGFYAEYVCTPP